jgi:alpha-L-fucosidase
MFEADWNSIQNHHIPAWLKECKFGIYTHWGVYSVPACGPNATWYAYNMYRDGSLQNLYHRLNFGPVSQFGYKDFIPEFTAKNFDPDEWAELFKKSGAGFAGPVGEHHEGFSMWKTHFNRYNAFDMGPKRDIVGELAQSIRKQHMKFMIAMHHAETWYFYPHWKKDSDVSDGRYSDLYGSLHNMEWGGRENEIDPNVYIPNHEKLWPKMQPPSKEFLDRWLNKLKELVDVYIPDLLWFDFGLKYIQEDYKKNFVSYYYNKALELKKEFVITYKWHNLVVGSGIEDLEQGTREDLAYNFWVTDTTVDDGEAWGYIYNNSYKKPHDLICYLIDNVSKNGSLILSIGPQADGIIPDPVKNVLLEIGKWLDVNGEAIRGTTPWIIAGEGPTKLKRVGPFSEMDHVQYTGKDIRFTIKGNTLYAICLGWPGKELLVKSVYPYIYPGEIGSVQVLGYDGTVSWRYDENGLLVQMPDVRPCDYAYSVKITRVNPHKATQ